MNKALCITGLALAIIGGSSVALADHGKGDGQGNGMRGDPQQRMQRMQKHLDLSEEQMQQMRTIRDSGASREQQREQMRNILNDEQRARIEAHHARRQQQGGGHHGRPPTDTEELN